MGTGAVVAELRDEVLARVPVDEREQESIGRFVAMIQGLADPFSEHADPVHVTASAIVIGAPGVVLHRHKRLGLWLQPGGHVDPGEMPWDAASREALEETGLVVRHVGPFVSGRPGIVHVDVHPGPRGHTHLDLRYLVEAEHTALAPADGESPDVAWFAWADAISMTDPGLAGALRSLAPG